MGYSPIEFPIPVVLYIDHDPAADNVLPLFRAPKACKIVGARATVADDVAASTANYFSLTLVDGGADGAGTAEFSDAIGGTPGWTGLTPKSFAITGSQHRLDAGDVVQLKYDEEGTGTFVAMTVQLEVVYGM